MRAVCEALRAPVSLWGEVVRRARRLRGVPPEATPHVVSDLLVRLGLAGAARRPCGTLSGGNKRKLALAVSLVSDCVHSPHGQLLRSQPRSVCD